MADRREELRSARLLLGGDVPREELLAAPEVREAVRPRGFPAAPRRLLQQVERKRGRLDYERAVEAPLGRARRAALGSRAAAPPRFLVRVDEFPHYQAWDDPGRYGSERYARFHETMSAAGVPYLIAVLPRLSRSPLDPGAEGSRPLAEDEREMLARLAADPGVEFALHGLAHRTRHASPRRHSELTGLDRAATEGLLDRGLGELAPLGIEPRVFVPPYNRFDAGQYAVLAARFAVVCGGPESIGTLGFHLTPMWHGEAVYLPSYEPLYGHAAEVLPAARRLLERREGLWAPIVLHWGWEADEDWHALERLAAEIASAAASWQQFLAAVDASAAP